MTAHANLAALRAELAARGLDGFVVPLTDEHMSEYVGAYAQRLGWLTGFGGSAGSAVVLDLRAGMAYRGGHIPQAVWTIRPRLTEALAQHVPAGGQVVLVADDTKSAAWAVASEWPQSVAAPLLLVGGMQAWLAAGYPQQATPDDPPDAACIDYLFFVHDRHDGNKEAARQYLAWETGLVAQLDAQERAGFRIPAKA